MKYAPVVLFVYNRADHTRQTVGALAANELAAVSDLWIFSDGPKDGAAESQVEEVREFVASLAGQSFFRSVTIVESENNKGLADSIIQGVTTVMADSDRAIVLEDDLVTAPDFLAFMNDCLDFFKDKSVGAISGYSPLTKLPSDYSESVYTTKRNCSHGWATWSDRWRSVDWEVGGFDRVRRSKRLRREFDSTGADRFDRLRRQVEHDVDSWSIRFGFDLLIRDLCVIYPSVNRVSNIGFDGTGVHTRDKDRKGLNAKICSHCTPYNLTFPVADARISKLFYDLYSGSFFRVATRRLRNSQAAFAIRSVSKKLRALVG